MQLYTQDSSRPYASQATYMSQHTRPEISQPDQQLPSIKDVIHPASASGSTTPDHNASVPRAIPYLGSSTSSAMMVSTVAAPVQPMGYGSGLGSTHPMTTPSTSPSDYSSPWSAGSQQYDTSSTVSSQGSLPSQHQPYPGMLPSAVSETPDHSHLGFSSSYGSMTKAVPYGSTESPTTDSYNRWPRTQLTTTQRYTPYLMSDRSYNQSSPDYSRYGQNTYDQYRGNIGYLESSPYAMKYNCLSYPFMGYPSNTAGRRRRGNLPKDITDILRLWLQEHLDHPYPSDEQKQIFMARTGLSISQISNWFINARRRQLPQLKMKRAKQLAGRIQKT